MPIPLIGLTGRRVVAADVTVIDGALAECELDLFYTGYASGVVEAGGQPVFLSLDARAAGVVPRLDGVLLTGGADFDPAVYGHEKSPDTKTIEPQRDRYEFEIFEAALAANVPVFGICRGIQIMNVVGGGSLRQHVPTHARYDKAIHALTQQIDIADGSTLAQLYGATHEINSLHHQSIDEVAEGYHVVARTADGEVEVIESDSDDVIGVQWHPEMMKSRAEDPIFGWLIDKAAKFSANRPGP